MGTFTQVEKLLEKPIFLLILGKINFLKLETNLTAANISAAQGELSTLSLSENSQVITMLESLIKLTTSIENKIQYLLFHLLILPEQVWAYTELAKLLLEKSYEQTALEIISLSQINEKDFENLLDYFLIRAKIYFLKNEKKQACDNLELAFSCIRENSNIELLLEINELLKEKNLIELFEKFSSKISPAQLNTLTTK